MPHFRGENLAEFHVWCAIAHRQGLVLVYTACLNIFILRQTGAHQSIKHVDACRIDWETNVTRETNVTS